MKRGTEIISMGLSFGAGRGAVGVSGFCVDCYLAVHSFLVYVVAKSNKVY